MSAGLDPRIAEALAQLPDYLGSHILVSVTALALGVALSIPLALVALRSPRLAPSPPRPRQRCADHSRTSAAGAVLSAPVGDRGALRALLRHRLFRPRLRAVRVGAGALQRAAGAAQHRDRAPRHRSGSQRSRAGRRHDAAPVAHPGRAAARAAGHHGRHSHGGGVGDRHGDAFDADRPDEPRQLHFHRAADAELDLRSVRMRRGGAAGARGRSVAGPDGERHA